MSWLPRAASFLAIAVAVAAGAIALLLFLQQRPLLYFPERYSLERAVPPARALGLEPWTDGDGAFLGWRSPSSSAAAARVLVLHGNAGSALDRGYLRDVLRGPGLPPLEVYLLEYPGYGPRPGRPSERALVDAATAAVDLLSARDGRPILLVGESIGSGTAALAAAERPRIAGLVLLTPLKSVPAVARRHFPWLPPLLLRDRFDAAAALARYGGPVAFLVAGEDEVVFADLGEALHAGYGGPKRLWIQPGRGHNTVRYEPQDPTWSEMVRGLLAGRW